MGTPSLASDAAWRPHEAQVLAGLLRSARVTVLYGESGPATTALLRAGVLPLLRSEPAEGAAGEVVVDFDDWNDSPLPALAQRLREALPASLHGLELPDAASLAERLAALHERLGLRFLFVLDRFEDFLQAPPDREDLRAFSHALVEAANQPGLPANFLIALNEEAKPLLKRLRRRIPGLAQHGLRLSARDDGTLELLPVLEQDADLRPRGVADTTPPAMKAQDVYASIETLLSKTAANGTREAAWQAPPGESEPEGADSIAPAVWRDSRPLSQPMPSPMQDAAAVGSATSAAVSSTARPWRAYAIAAAAMLSLLVAAWILGERAGRQQAVGESAAESMGATKRFVLMTEADASTDARLADELAQQFARANGVELSAAPAPDGMPAWAALSGPQLAIVRADALQAARDSGAPALRIVTPLFAEEVHVVVRADSPLKSAQQLRGQRINVGPAVGARARTASRLYEAMFGARMPLSVAGALPLDAALRQLLDRKGLDAIIVIDAQPSSWLAAQSPEALRAIRLLKLEAPPAARKVLRDWLPASLRGGLPGENPREATPTLALLSFLVTSAAYDDADPDAMDRFSRALCAALPSLRRDRHPKWLELQPGWREEAGWPYSPSAVRGFRACLAESIKAR